MLTFRAGPRNGNQNDFSRELIIKDERGEQKFLLAMRTLTIEGQRQRVASIQTTKGEVVWNSAIDTDPSPAVANNPDEPTPFRACMIAAELCDLEGNFAELTPAWVWGE